MSLDWPIKLALALGATAAVTADLLAIVEWLGASEFLRQRLALQNSTWARPLSWFISRIKGWLVLMSLGATAVLALVWFLIRFQSENEIQIAARLQQSLSGSWEVLDGHVVRIHLAGKGDILAKDLEQLASFPRLKSLNLQGRTLDSNDIIAMMALSGAVEVDIRQTNPPASSTGNDIVVADLTRLEQKLGSQGGTLHRNDR